VTIPQAPPESTEVGLVPAGEGWFVVNARTSRGYHAAGRPAVSDFGGEA
jgi:hypothetical protein